MTDLEVCPQHVACFARHISPQAQKGKRQLDCAGVVTTVLAICQALALRPSHACLADLQFQVRVLCQCSQKMSGRGLSSLHVRICMLAWLNAGRWQALPLHKSTQACAVPGLSLPGLHPFDALPIDTSALINEVLRVVMHSWSVNSTDVA